MKCPCIRKLIFISIVAILTIAFHLFIAYNGVDYGFKVAELIVSTLGAIAIPITIWWLSDYRKKEIEEKERQILVWNKIIVEVTILSKKILQTVKILQHSSDLCNKNIINNDTLKIITYLHIVDYSNDDILFISTLNRKLYTNLILLKTDTKQLLEILSFRTSQINNLLKTPKNNNVIAQVVSLHNQTPIRECERIIYYLSVIIAEIQQYFNSREKERIMLSEIENNSSNIEILAYKLKAFAPDEK